MSTNPYSWNDDAIVAATPCPPCPPCGNTFTHNETIRRGDIVEFLHLNLKDTIQRSDKFIVPSLKLDDTIQRRDDYKLPNISFTGTETLQRSDKATFGPFTLTAIARSGTPDTDDWGDAYTDNTVGSTGTNHGNVSPLSVAGGAAGIGVLQGYVEINLTRFTGFTALGSATITAQVSCNSAISGTQTFTLHGGPSALGGGATRPFTESTITQANQPATPAAFAPTYVATTTTNFVTATWTLTAAELNTILGKWALLVITSAGGTVATPLFVKSREAATAAERMTITMTLQV